MRHAGIELNTNSRHDGRTQRDASEARMEIRPFIEHWTRTASIDARLDRTLYPMENAEEPCGRTSSRRINVYNEISTQMERISEPRDTHCPTLYEHHGKINYSLALWQKRHNHNVRGQQISKSWHGRACGPIEDQLDIELLPSIGLRCGIEEQCHGMKGGRETTRSGHRASGWLRYIKRVITGD